MMKKMRTDERGMLTLLIIFVFLYVLNYLTPLGFGDDYLYSFIWQGNAMNDPLSANAARVSSFSDLLASQWSHYLTWGGRSVAHTLAQLFLWKGKVGFNFVNAFVGTLLVVEIYWCIHKGKVSFSFEPKIVFWIFFALSFIIRLVSDSYSTGLYDRTLKLSLFSILYCFLNDFIVLFGFVYFCINLSFVH